ncbi:hypothetical protein VHEMI05935 [[Torrubiella] hemipterigena]|uniref:Uncharacterized protein n=1 Tax=[Torrubiella] hemipterigena TaxID=1531966 RepID=A0A0A1SZ90_9HYPO|nr:hypothetical protein VHEMI05935 [[Torrubiella] hemipterigena]
MSNPNDYTVGWICAIEPEYLAAQICLDEKHPMLNHQPSIKDTNTYTLGKISNHNVVIACLPDGANGLSSATNVATNMLRSFPNVTIGLTVGIGGGAPTSEKGIRLGDIVVSSPRDGKGGVFQYDFGKMIQEQDLRTTGFLNRPPTALLAAIMSLNVDYRRKPGTLEAAINRILEKEEEELKEKLSRPDASADILYRSNFVHPKDEDALCSENCVTDPSNTVSRPERTKRPHSPVVHYGLIASANQLMMDALRRDELAKMGVLCFEMEAAGLMNDFPCLVVRGIRDYSDSHKNNDWQGYAALAAAVYTKDLLSRIPPAAVENEKKIVDVISGIKEDINQLVHWKEEEKNKTTSDQLTCIDYISEQEDIFNTRQDGTGRWLLDAPEVHIR